MKGILVLDLAMVLVVPKLNSLKRQKLLKINPLKF